jgi:hypothetical protein
MDGYFTGFFGFLFAERAVWREQRCYTTKRADAEIEMETETGVESDSVGKFPAGHNAIMGMLVRALMLQ